MNNDTPSTILEAFNGSAEGRLHFGQVIGLLMEAGVESYVADYRTGRATCYLPDDRIVEVNIGTPSAPIGRVFDADGVKAAIRQAQQGVVKYPEFKRLTQAAGCTAYTVWITGRRVDYVGRNGELHVEPFP